jgi:glycosyltransferase involved in cell wall biosynthesis
MSALAGTGTGVASDRDGDLSRLPITIVIPVKNEAHNLPGCLAALNGASNVVVVDSGSTDATVEIAMAHKAQVVDFRWAGGFPKKRNWILQTYRFKTEWVLFLDADEHLTQEFRRELAAALNRADLVGYWLNYNNHFLGRTLRHGIPQRKLALFKVGSGFYERIEDPGWSNLDMEVHEHPILSGAIGEIAAPIDHQDFRGLRHFIARHNEYSSWEARRYLAMRADPAVWEGLTRRQRLKYQNLSRWWFPAAYFLLTYVIRGGWLDGRAGLDYAWLKFIYFYEIRLKIAEALGPSAV